MPEAPKPAYILVTDSTLSTSLITPFEGDFLLYSAITPVLVGSTMNCFNEYTFLEKNLSDSNAFTPTSFFRWSTSFLLWATICSSMFITAMKLIFQVADKHFRTPNFQQPYYRRHHTLYSHRYIVMPSLHWPIPLHFVPMFLHPLKFSKKFLQLLQLNFHLQYLKHTLLSCLTLLQTRLFRHFV